MSAISVIKNNFSFDQVADRQTEKTFKQIIPSSAFLRGIIFKPWLSLMFRILCTNLTTFKYGRMSVPDGVWPNTSELIVCFQHLFLLAYAKSSHSDYKNFLCCLSLKDILGLLGPFWYVFVTAIL